MKRTNYSLEGASVARARKKASANVSRTRKERDGGKVKPKEKARKRRKMRVKMEKGRTYKRRGTRINALCVKGVRGGGRICSGVYGGSGAGETGKG